METIYELKNKRILMPIKLLLLVIAVAMFGLNTYAQAGKSVKVANDQQLIEAMGNSLINTIELAPGYYAFLDVYASEGTKVIKYESGNRSSSGCTYYILGANYCYRPTDEFTDPDLVVHVGFSYGQAQAGVDNATCVNPPFPALCCPNDGSGRWSVTLKPIGAPDPLFYDTTLYEMDYWVGAPGKYMFKYTWDPNVNPLLTEFAEVETEYNFYGPSVLELSAVDTCGKTTLIDFVFEAGYDPFDVSLLEWFVDYYPYGNPIPFVGPTSSVEGYEITVDYCGFAIISVRYVAFLDCYTEASVEIEFSCEPEADAGADAYVCYDNCYVLMGSTGMGYTFSDNYAFTFVQLGGPASLIGLPAGDNEGVYFETEVCLPTADPCPYGVYEIEFQVTNGLCYDSDTMLLTFYEAPEAYAGPDASYCDELCFSLAAVPYEYCGEPGVNYWKHAWWELISQPEDGCTVIFDEFDPATNVCIAEDCECAYGEYIFRWNELNVMVVGGDTLWSVAHCYAFDDVVIRLFEQPVADAGDDYWACVDAYNTPYTYQMEATMAMEYCYSMYGMWTKTCGPGGVVFEDIYSGNSYVYFQQPGRYIFQWKMWNAECADSALVLFDWLEQPEAITGDYLMAPCDSLCVNLGQANVQKYIYWGTDEGECPNYWDKAHWILIEGPDGTDPLQAEFAEDEDPDATLCVSWYGGYTVGWVELNQPDDKDYYCSDTSLVFVEFFETPDPFAGDDTTICGYCYTLMGVPYEYLPLPNQHGDDYYYWEVLPYDPVTGFNFCTATLADFEEAVTEVCIPNEIPCYGTYGFVFHQSNDDVCFGSDTVYITFEKEPDPICLFFTNESNCFDPFGNYYIRGALDEYGCICPDEVIEVCADGCTTFSIDIWNEFCESWFNPYDPYYFGWTFEWSVTGPAGMTYEATPGYYNGSWHYPWLEVCWGECCDTARIYLTITNEVCEATYEYKVFVNHLPCANIEGPDVSDVGTITEYCNVCPEDFNQECLLYTWTAEHCGEIISGQGTECIEVLWTDYNVNGGWGRVTLTVLDTCTGCCNYDEMLVKIHPSGTVGTDTLFGQVLYHNDIETPLNGATVTLWNQGVVVFETESYVKFVEDDPPYTIPGYYEFPNINGATPFRITATHTAPWYGANATDALAVELKVVGLLFINVPSFVYDTVVYEAMDVNNSNTISATDALWIKQRAVGMVTFFPAGDWVASEAMDSVYAADSPYDIWLLNAGDANRSNIPNSTKAVPAIELIADGLMNVIAGQEFTLPIRIAQANQFGAMTLNLGYDPAMIEVVDVVAMDGMLNNITPGNVSIAWSSTNPMVLSENDVVVNLKVKTTGEVSASDMMFTVRMESEFADVNARVVEPVILKTLGVSTSPAGTDYFLSSNRPNPFSTLTTIEYTLPETGKVRLSVLDMLGQEIEVLVESTQAAGSYSVEFSAAGLATGVYIYKITVEGETRDFISTQRMVISR